MSKRAGPALYEKMRAKQFSPRPPMAQSSDGVAEEPRASTEPLWAWLAPGRSVRLPVGAVLAIAAGMILLVVLAYTAGYQRGNGAARREHAMGGPALPGTTLPEGPVGDPLVQRVDQRASHTTASPSGAGESKPQSPVNAARQWPPVTTDPRQKGMNYFVLAETVQDGAVRLAEFCRSQGLETYVIPRHNTKTRYLVIALPGFSADIPRSSPQVKELEQRIHQIGDQWKATKRGETDLHDAYPRQYSGAPW